MTGIDILKQTKVNYYGNVKYNKPLCEITLFDWITKYSLKNKETINKIRELYNTDKKTAKKLKADYLPCITVTGKFNTFRRIDLCEELNPIIAIDIDYDDNTTITDWNKLKNKIAELPYVIMTSYSCSGKGLYCLVYFNKELNILNVFNSLKEEFNNMGVNIDTACKDITRARFVSYDDNILVRTNDVEMYNKELEEKVVEYTYKNDNTNIDVQFAFKAISYLIIVDKYRSNTYQNWLLDGFRLATLGNVGKVLFMFLSKMSENYNECDAENQFYQCVKRTKMNVSSITYYYKKLKDIHGDSWITLVNTYKC